MAAEHPHTRRRQGESKDAPHNRNQKHEENNPRRLLVVPTGVRSISVADRRHTTHTGARPFCRKGGGKPRRNGRRLVHHGIALAPCWRRTLSGVGRRARAVGPPEDDGAARTKGPARIFSPVFRCMLPENAPGQCSALSFGPRLQSSMSQEATALAVKRTPRRLGVSQCGPATWSRFPMIAYKAESMRP